VPSNITKYGGKINPSVWLEDYRHMCRAGGANDDMFIIQFLPIYSAESTIFWLGHLLRNAINHFDDIWEDFTGNFQGTYVCPDNPCGDLRSCRQKQGEPLQDYIWCFSQKFHTLPSVADATPSSTSSVTSNQKPLRSCLRSRPDMPQGRKPSEPPSLWWKQL
jgi:hypothetical protein